MIEIKLPYKRRLTKQRETILNILEKDHSHPNVKQIYKEAKKILHNISLATVYRNLNFLVEMGLIKKLNLQKKIDMMDKEKCMIILCVIFVKIYIIY